MYEGMPEDARIACQSVEAVVDERSSDSLLLVQPAASEAVFPVETQKRRPVDIKSTLAKTRSKLNKPALSAEDSRLPKSGQMADTGQADSMESPSKTSLLAQTVFWPRQEDSRAESEALPSPNAERGASAVKEPEIVFNLPHALDSIQRWMHTRGGEVEDLSTFLIEYAEQAKSLGVRLDRLFVGGLMLHPNVSAYVWKWEEGVPFESREIPRDVFTEKTSLYGSDAPFIVLMEGRAQRIRIRSSDPVIPEDCNWFKRLGYHDYFALPIKHRGEFKGAVAWCSKHENAFGEDHIAFFEQSMAPLSATVRTHTSDIVMSKLVGRLKEEVVDRTQELAQANQDLAKANRRILNQSQAQLRHFAMMSHEIRTPLNGIIGLCSVLEETSLNEEQQDLLKTIASSGGLLQRVVDDVLDYSKLAAGRMEIQREETTLQDVFLPVVRSMQTEANGRKIRIRTMVGPDVPDKIYSDGRRLQQIMYNLMQNAIKFSNPGGVVDFTVKTTGEGDSARIHFVLKDYGKGIARQNLGVVFQPFLQVHKDRGHLYGGTGLGLAITSKIVQALGGKITVDSELARWTEFHVDLPCHTLPKECPKLQHNLDEEVIPEDEEVIPGWYVRQDSQGSMKSSSASSSVSESASDSYSTSAHSFSTKSRGDSTAMTGASRKRDRAIEEVPIEAAEKILPQNVKRPDKELESLRVLVAEDNEVNRKLIRRVLTKIGIEDVDLVDNGLKAVEKVKEKVYDIVLMDMQMPVMDGMQATRLIKKGGGPDGITPQVVFVSAHALKEVKDEAEEAGADGFISKPFNINQIRDLLSSVVTERGRDGVSA